MSYFCLSNAQLKSLVKSRFGFSPKECQDIGDGILTLKRCHNLYEALSYATTGSLSYENAFRKEILNFIRYCWFNPSIKKILEDDFDLEDYAQKQQINFDSNPTPPWLEVKAAATFLQVNICVFIPSESMHLPTYCFSPAVFNLKKGKDDQHEYVLKGCINIAAHRIDNGKYSFEAVTTYPRSTKSVQSARRQRWKIDNLNDGEFVQLNNVKISYEKAIDASVTFNPYRNKHINVDSEEVVLEYLKTMIETEKLPNEAFQDRSHVVQLYKLAINFEIADLTDQILSYILSLSLDWKINFVNTEKESLLPTKELFDNLVDEFTNVDYETLKEIHVDPNLSPLHKKLRKVLEREKIIKSNKPQTTDTDKSLEKLKRFISEKTDSNIIMHICELIGYPKHKFLAKRRIGTTYYEYIDKILDDWYPVVKSFCEDSVIIQPKHLLARAFLVSGRHDLFEQLIPSIEKQNFVRANASSIYAICAKTTNAFKKVIRPIRT